MIKSKRLVDYKIPYVVLVSKFIEYFCVSPEGQLSEPIKQNYDVIATTLHKIRLKKVNNDHWICQAYVAAEADEEMVGDAADVNFSRFSQPFFFINCTYSFCCLKIYSIALGKHYCFESLDIIFAKFTYDSFCVTMLSILFF